MTATIAVRLCGVAIDIRGARPSSLANLARSPKTGFESTLERTEALLDARPFGTVPAAGSQNGESGIFESNSILRAMARLVPGE